MKLKYFFFLILISNVISINDQPKGIICKFCENMQRNLFDFYKKNKSKIISALDFLCKFKIYPDVCDYFLLREDPLIDNEINFLERTNYICSLTLNLCDKKYIKYDFQEFRKNLYKNYPEIPKIKKNSEKNNKIKSNFKNEEFKILTLNDVHLQKDYLYKSKVNCKGPSCCFEKSEKTKEKERKTKKEDKKNPEEKIIKDKNEKINKKFEEEREAGYWGSPMSKCDIPKHFWEKTLSYIKNQEELKTDFIILLGDNYGHNNYREKESIYDIENYFYDSILENFPNTNIIPVFGNHESDPVDFFDFDDKNNNVIKNLFPNLKKFISQEKIDDFINNGFYDLEYEKYGIKFIIINSQLQDTKNFFLLKKHTDLLNFFKKFSESVYSSEKKQQRVIILNHISLGNKGNYDGYEKNMNSIIERFSKTITASLSGHTHSDEIRFIKNKKKEIIHINYISPSITIFGNYNPSLRIYKFQNRKVNDYDQYRFYIDIFNKFAESQIFDFEFQKAYSFKNEYDLVFWDFGYFEHFFGILESDLGIQKIYLRNKYGGNLFGDWERERFFVKCQVLGMRLEQEECFYAGNGGFSVFDLLEPERLYRFLFVRPWVVLK